MATKNYDAMIRKAIQSGNYAVDTPKSVLQEMFPNLAQWRLDRLGMENFSEDTQSYINSPFSTIDNMDTSLMNYGTQDTFSYNRMNPASLQMQSVTELPYDPSTLNTVYQSPPPLQGPQPFVGPPEFNTTNYEPDLSTLQIADGLPYDSSTLNTVYESLPPIQGPQTSSEYYSNLKGWGRNPFVSEEFVDTEEGLVSKKWMEPATEPIVAQANTPLSNVSTGNTSLQGQAVDTGLGRNAGTGIDFSQRLSNTLTTGQAPIPGDPNYSAPSLPTGSNVPENITGMSFEEFMTPPDINIMDPQYDPQFGAGGGGFTDVTANQFTGTGQNPVLSSADSVSSAQSPLSNIGASEVLGAGMQVGSSLMAMIQY